MLGSSSPFEPEEWHYIDNRYDGIDNFPHFKEKVCFVGHSHRPVIIEEREPNKVHEYYDSDWKLKAGHRYIFNVGSLGQPRDGNPDPAFAILIRMKIPIRCGGSNMMSKPLNQKSKPQVFLPIYPTGWHLENKGSLSFVDPF